MLLFFAGSGIVSYLNIRTIHSDALLVTHTHEVLIALSDVLSLAKDAETGQRGYLITGDESYLAPKAIAESRLIERVNEIQQLTMDNPRQQARIPMLRSRIKSKIDELDETISTRQTQGADAAREIVLSHRGKVAMDEIRGLISEMENEERRLRQNRLAEMGRASENAVVGVVTTAMIGTLLAVAITYLLRRNILGQFIQEWLQSGQIRLGQTMSGDQTIESLGEKVLNYLVDFTHAQVGALYINNGDFRLVATYGVPANGGIPRTITPNDGLLWQVIKENKSFRLDDIPDGYLSYGTSLGSGKPAHLFVTPITEEGKVNGVIELGFIEPIDETLDDFFERISESIGITFRAVNYREHLQSLLEETQRQAEELQAQGEELRVSNEELEEQSRALRESQARLENQQTELEQTNSQLEEQTQLLEIERDAANRAKLALEEETKKLEQASRYKSDFLANMSHELRTPLNSSLILAKLLADNPAANLTEEQVEFARTIESAGNDLLALINDILDLSKIEAGHMQINPSNVRVRQIIDDLVRPFIPLAEQKGLTVNAIVHPNSPDYIETDRQRLEQILKNLLSNGIKFTEKGHVDIVVQGHPDGRVAFNVIDTGIGIPSEKQHIIFEAFQQADSTTSRRYGGTGLGLSITRELTRLLRGELRLESELNNGSTFTVILPCIYSEGSDKARVHLLTPKRKEQDSSPTEKTELSQKRQVEDDRAKLSSDRRVILVVEDDESFARILADLVHELDFQCIVATTADEGINTAIQYLPSAVLLDVRLPDNSGLSVLDRLKQDRRTRHIPVHVISAGDYAQTALSLGAVGYLLKPVKREELVAALKQLENRFDTRMRRVLVVEDDPIQLSSLKKLLGTQDVETIGATSAAECMEHLTASTFDCMVLDLSLPDASGYSLLETLSQDEKYAFPPVIVYTGRDLSTEEEHRLRKYSKSIIIKGAKSPERLLDEVTLFLHQVVSELPPEQQKMIEKARTRDSAVEGRRILIVEDDVRNVFALTSILEPRGANVEIARNGREAIEILERTAINAKGGVDLVLMDVMMPEMDGITAVSKIRERPEWRKLPIIMLTAKAMKDDQEACLNAGANDYMSKPLDVDKLLSLIRVWMPR
jgi:CheY-like chemotaxis protein/signal transduction histidine kinase/CHASE3 domain sensor protein